MKLKIIASAAILAVSAINASADTLGPVSVLGSSFSDLLVGTIYVSSLSNLVGSLYAFQSINVGNPYNLTLTLDTVTFTSASFGTLSGDADVSVAGFNFSNVAAGSYLVKASGTLGGNGEVHDTAFISANYTVTSVPEPETYAMMLAGLGAVGFIAFRRRRQD